MHLETSPLRIARPSANLERAQQFWCEGIGLEVLWTSGDDVEGGHRLLMMGAPGAAWHLELIDDAKSLEAHPPSPEDLIVLYLGPRADLGALAERGKSNGGTSVASTNPYWDHDGVTLLDPDGYRLVLSRRSWNPG